MKEEKLIHLITDCEALSGQQMDIMENKIPLPDMTWSIKRILKFIQLPQLDDLMNYNTTYTRKEIIYVDHDFEDSASTTSDSSL